MLIYWYNTYIKVQFFEVNAFVLPYGFHNNSRNSFKAKIKHAKNQKDYKIGLKTCKGEEKDLNHILTINLLLFA